MSSLEHLHQHYGSFEASAMPWSLNGRTVRTSGGALGALYPSTKPENFLDSARPALLPNTTAIPRSALLGVEIQPIMLETARSVKLSRMPHRVRFPHRVVPDSSTDVITAVMVLHGSFIPRNARRASRIKPGGRMIVTITKRLRAYMND